MSDQDYEHEFRRAQRREWFREGWLQSGAPIERLDYWFDLIDGKQSRETDNAQEHSHTGFKSLADYDDSLGASAIADYQARRAVPAAVKPEESETDLDNV